MVGMTSKLALKRRGSPSCTCRSVTRGWDTGVSPSLSVSLRKYRGTRASTTSLLMPSAKRCLITEAGAWPVRNPGMRASFWYFWIRVSVSRATSAAGISTSISRLVLLLVSVGLTFAFRGRPAVSGVRAQFRTTRRPSAYILECKDRMRAASNDWGHFLVSFWDFSNRSYAVHPVAGTPVAVGDG